MTRVRFSFSDSFFARTTIMINKNGKKISGRREAERTKESVSEREREQASKRKATSARIIIAAAASNITVSDGMRKVNGISVALKRLTD